jgi:hypothetical protein
VRTPLLYLWTMDSDKLEAVGDKSATSSDQCNDPFDGTVETQRGNVDDEVVGLEQAVDEQSSFVDVDATTTIARTAKVSDASQEEPDSAAPTNPTVALIDSHQEMSKHDSPVLAPNPRSLAECQDNDDYGKQNESSFLRAGNGNAALLTESDGNADSDCRSTLPERPMLIEQSS